MRMTNDKIQMTKKINIFVILFVLFIFGCGEYNQGESYPELSSAQAGLELTQAIHPTGWGKSECFLCHNIENLHLDRSGYEGTDFAAIREQVKSGLETTCATCHGGNGIFYYYGYYR